MAHKWVGCNRKQLLRGGALVAANNRAARRDARKRWRYEGFAAVYRMLFDTVVIELTMVMLLVLVMMMTVLMIAMMMALIHPYSLAG